MFVVMIVTAVCCFALYRKNMLCFKRRVDHRRPQIFTQEDIEKGLKRKQRLKGLSKQSSKKPNNPNYLQPQRPHKYNRKKSQMPFKEDKEELLQNPMLDPDLDKVDFSNPMFDHKKALVRDAAVTIQSWYRMWRERIPFLQKKEAATIIQSVWRGYTTRKMVPEYRKVKKERDVQRKRAMAYGKKKGALFQLKFYDVKSFGFAVVDHLYGVETIRNAAEQLKAQYGSRGKMRLKLFISVKGIKLFDAYTFQHYATVKISSVSFCTMDPRNRRLFAFINRRKKRNFCHVFHCLKEQDALKMVETVAELFEITFKQLQKEKEVEETRRKELLDKRRTKGSSLLAHSLAGSLAELDEEVENMMQMAGTHTPQGSPQIRPGFRQFVHMAEVHQNNHTGSQNSLSSTSSTEAILVKPQQTRVSVLSANSRQSYRQSPLLQQHVMSEIRHSKGSVVNQDAQSSSDTETDVEEDDNEGADIVEDNAKEEEDEEDEEDEEEEEEEGEIEEEEDSEEDEEVEDEL